MRLPWDTALTNFVQKILNLYCGYNGKYIIVH